MNKNVILLALIHIIVFNIKEYEFYRAADAGSQSVARMGRVWRRTNLTGEV